MTDKKLSPKLKEALELLEELCEDESLPKNIRSVCAESKKVLGSDEEIGLRIDSAVHILNSLAENSNISVYARTQLWNIISLLESA